MQGALESRLTKAKIVDSKDNRSNICEDEEVHNQKYEDSGKDSKRYHKEERNRALIMFDWQTAIGQTSQPQAEKR